jgi:hypothetical protein
MGICGGWGRGEAGAWSVRGAEEGKRRGRKVGGVGVILGGDETGAGLGLRGPC